MNRRTFITKAGVLAAASAWPLRAADKKPLRIGFLGATHSHAAEKFRILSTSPDFDLVGVCESNSTAREALAKLGAKFTAREELLERAEVIVIESAVRDHARDAMTALNANKHVHLEKPPAVTMRECEEIVSLAKAKNRLLQIGYMWRFHPGINRIIEAAQKGWLGDVFMVRAQINTYIAANRRPEWAEFKGGAMFELGCHLIDAVVRLLGKPARVTPHLQRRGGDDLADNCTVILEYPKAQAIITSAVLQPNAFGHRSFEVTGTNGTARLQPIEPGILTFDLAKAAGPYEAGMQQIELSGYRRYVGEFAEFSAALRGRRPLAVPLETELLTQEALLRACAML